MTRGDHALLCRRRYAVLRDVSFRASYAIAPDRFTPSTRWLWLVWKAIVCVIYRIGIKMSNLTMIYKIKGLAGFNNGEK